MKFLVAQLGARMHYGVPRLFHNAGMLSSLHTDICSTNSFLRVIDRIWPRACQPTGLKRLMGRDPEGIPRGKIRTHTALGLEYARRQRKASTAAEATAAHLWAGSAFCRSILKKEPALGAEAVYTFNSAGLELLVAAKKQGALAVMEQTIAPRAVEREILDPDFSTFQCNEMIEAPESWHRFAEREAAEWEIADLIICGSEFVVQGIRQVGGPAEKAVVVPYGVDVYKPDDSKAELGKARSLNVLFVGEVGIRKGAIYLIEAARLLVNANVSVRLVGKVSLPQSALENLPSNVKITGPIPRTEMWREFQWADVFCLPSLCEGSATVVYEALAYGLPVICTQNTGSVVRHGVDGYLVPIRDVQGISEHLETLQVDRELLKVLSISAERRAMEFTLSNYGQRLLAAIGMQRT